MQVNGRALRAIREARGVSQRTLAGNVGCSHSLISRYESGERGKRFVTDAQLVQRIAAELGVTPSALTRGEAA